MSQLVELDVKDLILSNGSFGPTEIQQLSHIIGEDFAQFKLLKEAVEELESVEQRTPASAVRLGVGLFLLGRYESAARVLRKCRRRGARLFLPWSLSDRAWQGK